MATAWLTDGGDDDLLDLGDVSPITAGQARHPPRTLACSPLGEISPANANARPASDTGVIATAKPFPFAPSPFVKASLRVGPDANATTCPASTATKSPSCLGKRASPEPDVLAKRDNAAVSPATLRSSLNLNVNTTSAASPVFAPPPAHGSRLELGTAPAPPRLTRRKSLGLDAFQGFIAVGKGLLDDDDDFVFAPSFTPRAAKAPMRKQSGAFAPVPMIEEEEENTDLEDFEEEDLLDFREEDVRTKGETVLPSPAKEAKEASPNLFPPVSTDSSELDRKINLAVSAADKNRGSGGLCGGGTRNSPVRKQSRAAQNSPPACFDAFESNEEEKEENDANDANDASNGDVCSDDDTVELNPDYDVSMMDVEEEACADSPFSSPVVVLESPDCLPIESPPTAVSTENKSPKSKAPSAALAAPASPIEANVSDCLPIQNTSSFETKRKGTEAGARSKLVTPRTESNPRSENQPSLDDSFERKLQAAMVAAERGGGLSGLSGGMRNSPVGGNKSGGMRNSPVGKPCVATVPALTPPPYAAGTSRREGAEETTKAGKDAAGEKKNAPLAKKSKPAAAPKESVTADVTKKEVPKEEVAKKGTTFPVVPGSNPAEDDDFERKITAAMALAEKGGGLSGLSGGMQNSPPGSSRPVFAAAANYPDCLPIDDAEPPSESCLMDHDGEATPRFARAKTHGTKNIPDPASSPVSVSASPPERRNLRGAKPVPKNTKAKTPTAVRTAALTTEKETDNGTTPPGVDFERMLAKAMAAANDAEATDMDKVLGAQNSSKMMNSPAPLRRQTPARAAKQTPESSTQSVEKTPTSARAARVRERVTAASAVTKARVESKETAKPSAKPEWVSNSGSVDLARSCSDTSVENESIDDVSLTESPVISPPCAPPPPPTAWLTKAAAAKAPPLPKPEWVSLKNPPVVFESAKKVSSHTIHAAVPLAVPALAASAVLAALAAGQQKKLASEEPIAAFDFEAKLLAAMRAETLGGAAAFGGESKVCNSPDGNSTGHAPPKLSLKEDAKRQGVTVAQLMHAQAHAESSPLAKVRF